MYSEMDGFFCKCRYITYTSSVISTNILEVRNSNSEFDIDVFFRIRVIFNTLAARLIDHVYFFDVICHICQEDYIFLTQQKNLENCSIVVKDLF